MRPKIHILDAHWGPCVLILEVSEHKLIVSESHIGCTLHALCALYGGLVVYCCLLAVSAYSTLSSFVLSLLTKSDVVQHYMVIKELVFNMTQHLVLHGDTY